MAESALDNQALLKRTLVTAGAMVGACVLFVGTVTLIAVGIVGHAVSGTSGAASDAGPAATTAIPRGKINVPAAPVPSK
jgi:hypothetical protein